MSFSSRFDLLRFHTARIIGGGNGHGSVMSALPIAANIRCLNVPITAVPPRLPKARGERPARKMSGDGAD